MNRPAPISILEPVATECLCGHQAHAHSLFGCLTCAAKMADPCEHFVSRAKAKALLDRLR